MAGSELSGRRASLNQITLKEEMFVREYLIDLNGMNAAVRAGYSPSAGAKLLKRLAVKDAVDRAIAARSARVGISAERVLDELGNVAFFDVRDLFDDNGSLKPISRMSADTAKFITGMKTRRTVSLADDGKTMQPEEITEYKFVDKLAALGLVMRHLGMFKDTLSIEVTSLADRLRMAQVRVGVKEAPRAVEGPEDIEDVDFEEVNEEPTDSIEDYI